LKFVDAPRPSRFAARALTAALAAVCAASVAAWLAPLGWPFELFSHFRLQLLCAAALLVPALLVARSPRAAIVAGALAALLFASSGRRLLAAEPAPACHGDAFVVVTANVQYTNRDPQRLLDWLAGQQPDVIVLQEVTPAWAAALTRLTAYPHAYTLPRSDPYGIAMLSRWRFESIEPLDLAGDGIPSLDAVVQVRGRSVHVLGLHTRWPITPGLARLRDRALERATTLARERPMPTVLAGDLNLTPDAPLYSSIIDQTGLRDVLAGRGWHPTWMAGFWPLALRIDHQFASAALCVEHAKVGPDIGSDHRPLIARYRLAAAPGS
jgi:endonuclease/exonuclease/phosphatase (EEP) superfamily protein YafD